MAITLPDFCPVGASYTPPSFPVGKFTALNGGTKRVLFGNKSSGAELELRYNLRNWQAAEWCRRYELAFGEFDEVIVGESQFVEWQAVLDRVPPHIRWRFAEPPRLDRESKNRVNLTVRLIGELEAP